MLFRNTDLEMEQRQQPATVLRQADVLVVEYRTLYDVGFWQDCLDTEIQDLSID
jgi:hypothetical protein